MKKFLLILSIFLVGCSNQPGTTYHISSPSDEESWPYPFVIYDGQTYKLTGEKVEEDFKGEKLGEVKRNIVNMDVDENLVEMNFDSTGLNTETPLYANIKEKDSILYEENGEYYLAKKVEGFE
ncbi:hypothetical protein [Bacillus alkalicellulosilyticus]|uniref:hypothetical protein n=1 Tax=Alkalihalobacterium alkalicellulosilyticum TaxID=1912214 RepID=UPI0009984171|nr:hypothetical protein [Bacillus alkalicellulosilyticus]